MNQVKHIALLKFVARYTALFHEPLVFHHFYARRMNSALQSALQQERLHWAQKAAISTFSIGIFFWGLDRTVPAIHNFLMGAISCHG